MSKTTYQVLYKDGGSWHEFEDTVEATSTTGALRAAWNQTDASFNGEPFPVLVAVPTRSWRPQPVRVETQQRLKIG